MENQRKLRFFIVFWVIVNEKPSLEHENVSKKGPKESLGNPLNHKRNQAIKGRGITLPNSHKLNFYTNYSNAFRFKINKIMILILLWLRYHFPQIQMHRKKDVNLENNFTLIFSIWIIIVTFIWGQNLCFILKIQFTNMTNLRIFLFWTFIIPSFLYLFIH